MECVNECVNKCKDLDFYFSTKNEQIEISAGYKGKSGASFPNVIGAIDGILIWILKPTPTECKYAVYDPGSFKCSRKDKFCLNMQAIYDHKFRIRWINIEWPGCASDKMAWITSDLFKMIESNVQDMIIPGMFLLGDSAYVNSTYMTTPFRINVNASKDAYNFYQSQLCITIEQTIGILVHHWAILRGTLDVPIIKVAPLVMTLCCLHNFCILAIEK